MALKILEASFEPIAKTLDEARIGNKFNHKNLLPIHYADVYRHNGKTYTLISQEFFQNGDITNYLNSNNFLPLPEVLKILQDILFGLEYLHNGGYYHNDIKPANILLDDKRNGVLADYGISDSRQLQVLWHLKIRIEYKVRQKLQVLLQKLV